MPGRSRLGRRGAAALVAAALSAVLVAGCGGGSATTSGKTGGDGGGHPKPAPPVTLSLTPDTGTKKVTPIDPVVARAAHGTLTTVDLTNAQGKQVKGKLSKDRTSWAVAEKLGYGKSYTLSATATNPDGKKVTRTSTFTTVTPGNYTLPYLRNENGVTYGVGEPVMVHFDEPIPDRAAAERSLTVETSPKLEGAWHWLNDQDVHWRPKTDDGQYWPAGTKVTVKAAVYGVHMGGNLWGQQDREVSFAIGDKHVAIGDNKSLHMKAYVNDKMVRDAPFSGGRDEYIVDKYGNKVPLSTPSGTMVVMSTERRVHMTSASWGISKKNPMAYDTWVDYGTRLTTDGIYLHAAPWNMALHGKQNDSHGCINLSNEDAKWFFQHFRQGDVVIMSGTNQHVTIDRGYGDWNLSWDEWVKGSALQ